MAFVTHLLNALAWATFLLWWLWVCWSILDRSFEWGYLAAGVLPLSLWAGSRALNKRVDAALTDAESLRRYHQSRDRGSRYIRAKARNQWRDNRWKLRLRQKDEQEHSVPD